MQIGIASKAGLMNYRNREALLCRKFLIYTLRQSFFNQT